MLTTPKERPILFSGPMVRAIMDGRKTQTRRIVKPQPPTVEAVKKLSGSDFRLFADAHFPRDVFRVAGPVWAVRDLGPQTQWKCPYGGLGDRLWVRETFCQKCEDGYPVYTADGNLDSSCYHYRADGYHVVKADGDGGTEFTKDGREASPWKPSIFMPRHASRLTLEVTAVRVERLQEITEADAQLEGFQQTNTVLARSEFIRTWKLINGGGTWSANPWVWVVSFKRVDQE